MPMKTIHPWRLSQRMVRNHAARVLFSKVVAVRPERPLISFTFDDFPRSAWITGGAILNSYGAAGTYYASLGQIGSEGLGGPMFAAEDLSPLLAQGHELGCHTFAHCDSWDTRPDEFENSVIQNRVALQELLPGSEFRSFSYPISLPRPMTKARVSRHFECCRGGGQTLNAGRTDLNQLSAFFLEKTRGNFDQVQALIERNRALSGWLILATHDISELPSPYGCTPQFFEKAVSAAVASGAQVLPVIQALEIIMGSGREAESKRVSVNVPALPFSPPIRAQRNLERPLVSILIPAYNSEEWIADTLRSALAQTWEPKEIIVVDDGSTDRTLAVARQFEAEGVRVIAQTNMGGSAARNTAFAASRGEYIQWLDADDLLAREKIERQMEIALQSGNKRIALSSPFGRFRYRWDRAEFESSELWTDLSPAEWLCRKMAHNLYMQTGTWLISRELAEAAGGWDTRMYSDDDGEYFCRVLLQSEGVRFVPDTKVYYRAFRYGSLAYLGKSSRKIDALWCSMERHIDYLLSLEDTPRTRAACIAYLQRNLIHFFPNQPELVCRAEQLAEKLGGRLTPPHLSWKYSWAQALFGWGFAKNVSLCMRKSRWVVQKHWDKVLFQLHNRNQAFNIPTALPQIAASEAVLQARLALKGRVL